ncbi:urate hydroxylase PuuD [Acidiphilium sp.]|uniref:urate hydroxylase PuuD n=1 Tax=Acidiphilium sp. TaxID=527 RepID=UPI00258DC1DE|nr:urate hydroxylase PuuD [Acidiphilium sp.]
MFLMVADPFLRVLHIMAIIVWMGHNWANVISRPRYRRILPEDPPAAMRDLFIAAAQREHGVFRHASLVALTTGILMLLDRGQLADALRLHGASAPLGLGVWLGVIMVANLWFVLWPHQKKVLGFVAASDHERLRCTRVTFLSSRTNTILSLPAIFLMVMGAHGAALF